MHTASDVVWTGVPTAADELFFPSITFGEGGAEGWLTLLVAGRVGPQGPVRGYMFVFQHVEAISGFSETVYWSLAQAAHRPPAFLNTIENSALLEQIQQFREADYLRHFLLCGGDMCCEIVAGMDCEVIAFESERALEEAAIQLRQDAIALLKD